MITTIKNESKILAVEILSPTEKKGTTAYIMFGSKEKLNEVKKRGYGIHHKKMVYRLAN